MYRGTLPIEGLGDRVITKMVCSLGVDVFREKKNIAVNALQADRSRHLVEHMCAEGERNSTTVVGKSTTGI
jgi:hypothetical protein